jgi:hypothetical protein
VPAIILHDVPPNPVDVRFDRSIGIVTLARTLSHDLEQAKAAFGIGWSDQVLQRDGWSLGHGPKLTIGLHRAASIHSLAGGNM